MSGKNQQEPSLLDELDESHQAKQEQQQAVQQGFEKGREAVKPVVEQMDSYAREVESRGVPIEYNSGVLANNLVAVYKVTLTGDWLKDSLIYSRDVKQALIKNSTLQERINPIYGGSLRVEDVGYEDLTVENMLGIEIIPDTETPQLSFHRNYHADVYYARDYSVSLERQLSTSERLLLSKSDGVTDLSLSGEINLKPEGFMKSDVENCFKFLLGKSKTVQLSGEAGSEVKSKSGGCFIATAVYGSGNNPEVLVLKSFRDNVLLPLRIGRALVYLYYIFSPPISRLLSTHLWLRNMVRKTVVQPIVDLVRAKFHIRGHL